MSMKTFEIYMEKCRLNNIEPTLRGAAIYKKYGVLK